MIAANLTHLGAARQQQRKRKFQEPTSGPPRTQRAAPDLDDAQIAPGKARKVRPYDCALPWGTPWSMLPLPQTHHWPSLLPPTLPAAPQWAPQAATHQPLWHARPDPSRQAQSFNIHLQHARQLCDVPRPTHRPSDLAAAPPRDLLMLPTLSPSRGRVAPAAPLAWWADMWADLHGRCPDLHPALRHQAAQLARRAAAAMGPVSQASCPQLSGKTLLAACGWLTLKAHGLRCRIPSSSAMVHYAGLADHGRSVAEVRRDLCQAEACILDALDFRLWDGLLANTACMAP